MAVALFSFALYSFVFAPLAEKISFLDKEIDSRELRLKKSQKILSREQVVEGDFKKHEQYLKQNSSDEQEMASLLSEIENVAHQVNVRINDMKPRKVKRVDFYNNFAVEIQSEGSLAEITKFIYTLQNPPHLLKAEKLRLEKQAIATSTLKGFLLVSKILIPQ
jgi:Tfp pilus assembly protein PilO